MIPIRDINPRIRVPFVNYALLAACVLGFAYQILHLAEADAIVRQYGFVPASLDEALRGTDQLRSAVGLTVLTSMFLHGGWIHVIGNLLYLRVFGDNIEDRLGHLGYLVFYLAAGAAGALGHWLVDPTSTVPVVGASGAIAGALGAYIVLYPRARILTLFPVFIFLTFLEVPAFVFLGIWGVQQFLNGFLSVAASATSDGGVAWFAHIGGFALGVVVGGIVRLVTVARRRRRARAA